MDIPNPDYPLPERAPMTHENIWRAASYMIDLYGDDAAVHAGQHASKLLELGDQEGFFLWKEVARTIERLKKRAADEAVN